MDQAEKQKITSAKTWKWDRTCLTLGTEKGLAWLPPGCRGRLETSVLTLPGTPWHQISAWLMPVHSDLCSNSTTPRRVLPGPIHPKHFTLTHMHVHTHTHCSNYFLSLYPILFPFIVLMTEKAMAPHSSTLAWKIPWTEERGGLQSTGLLRIGHSWTTSLSLFTFMHWRRKSKPNPVFLPGESQGRGSLVGCHLWGHTESDMTEVT